MNRHAYTIIYSMYRVDALRTPIRLRAGYPTLLQWRGGGTIFFQAQDQSSVTIHVRVGNRVVSHSLDVVSKMYKHIIYSHFFTCTISETLFKLITHCFCCLIRCVELSRSLTMSMPDSASFIMIELHMLMYQASHSPQVKHLAWR